MADIKNVYQVAEEMETLRPWSKSIISKQSRKPKQEGFGLFVRIEAIGCRGRERVKTLLVIFLFLGLCAN
jgi:hypothetical protein